MKFNKFLSAILIAFLLVGSGFQSTFAQTAKSDYLEGALQDHTFGIATFTAPATVYVALSTADPTDAGTGIAEPSGGSYARAAVTNNGTNWTRTGGQISNATVITYAQATGDWGSISHFAIYDAVTGGNMLYYGEVNSGTPVAILTNDTPEWAIGTLTVTED